MSRQPISQATLLEDPDLSVDKLRSIGNMFEIQCVQFVGCLYGSAINRGLDPFYANGNLAGSAFKKAGRSLRKWMADGSVYVALHQGATEPTEQAASILPLCRPLCLPEQQGLEKQLHHLGAYGSREAVAALRKRPRKVDQIKSFEFAFT